MGTLLDRLAEWPVNHGPDRLSRIGTRSATFRRGPKSEVVLRPCLRRCFVILDLTAQAEFNLIKSGCSRSHAAVASFLELDRAFRYAGDHEDAGTV